MPTNKPEVYRVLGHRLHDDGPIEKLPYDWIRVIRLSDYEALQAECEKLRKAIRRLCNIYVVDDYYDGQLRDERLEAAVNRAINDAMETTK